MNFPRWTRRRRLGPGELAGVIEDAADDLVATLVERAAAFAPGQSYLAAVWPTIVPQLRARLTRTKHAAGLDLPAPLGTYSVADLNREFEALCTVLDARVDGVGRPTPAAVARLERALGELRATATERILLDPERATDRQKWIRAALNRLPNSLFFLNIETQSIWFSNQTAKRMLGLSDEDDTRLANLLPHISASTPDGRPVAVPDLPSQRTLRGESIRGEELVLRTARGRFHVRVFSEQLPAAHGEPRSALLVLQDISSLKAREAEIHQREAELRFTMESARMGAWTIDFVAGGRGTLSAEAQKILHCRPAYSSAHVAMEDFVHPADRARIGQMLDATVADGRPYNVEYRFLTPNGELRWAASIARAIYDDAGKIAALSGIVMDVTDRKRAEGELERAVEEMRAAKQQAEDANESKSRFLANVSHEIRTPLGAIMGFASLLHDPALALDQRRTFLGIIERNSSQLLRIIDDILDLSKVEAGRMRVEHITFDLGRLLAEFTVDVGHRAREKNVEYVTRLLTPIPTHVTGDPTRTHQILTNVVGNAIKFTDHGRVELRVSFDGDRLDLQIEDSGPGISDEERRQLFRPFGQADTSITRRFGGTGLGLILTRHLAEALGGHFKLLESQPGRGSTFAVRLRTPAAPGAAMTTSLPEADEEDAPRAARAGELEKLRILVVDDSHDNRSLLGFYLEPAGARVDFAVDGVDGARIAREKSHDVILMDVQMPVMDGVTAVRTLRSEGFTTPILALTAHAMKEERRRCLEAGYTDFLTKPITRERLIEALRGYRPRLTEVTRG